VREREHYSHIAKADDLGLPRVATEMALHVLAYNLTRVSNIMVPGPLIAAIKT
jgi:hypothetical protein